MEKRETTYLKSVDEIVKQHIQVFYRPYNLFIVSNPLEKPDKLVDNVFLYQSALIVNLTNNVSNKIFSYDLLYDAFLRALTDTIIQLELDSTLVDFKFTISHTYYMIVKDNKINQYSYFMGHGNTKNPYIHDNVYFFDGISTLQEYTLYTLETNHLEEAKVYFHSQFPHSDVTIHSVSHIVYLIQPFDMTKGIKKKLFYISNIFDDYFELM